MKYELPDGVASKIQKKGAKSFNFAKEKKNLKKTFHMF